MARLKGSPRMKEVVDYAERLGYTVERTRNCHIRFRHPNGAHVHCGTTPSDHRTIKNVRSQLRRERAQAAQNPKENQHGQPL